MKSAVTSHLPPAFSHRSWIWHLVPRHRVSGPGRLPWLHRASPSATLDKIDREHCDDAARRQEIFTDRLANLARRTTPKSRPPSKKQPSAQARGRSAETVRTEHVLRGQSRRYPAAYERDLATLLLPPLERCAGWQLTHGAGNVPICQSQPADTFQRVHLVGNACAVQTVGQRVLAV